MDIAKFKAASAEIADGSWGDAKGIPGVRVKVRGSNHPVLASAFGRAIRLAPPEYMDENGHLNLEGEKAINRQVYANEGLMDWEGWVADGEPLPFNRDYAFDLLGTDQFLQAVRAVSAKVAEEDAKRIEALAKNSQAPSKRQTRAKTSD